MNYLLGIFFSIGFIFMLAGVYFFNASTGDKLFLSGFIFILFSWIVAGLKLLK